MLQRQALLYYGSGSTAALLSRIKWARQVSVRPPTFRLSLRGSERADDVQQRFISGLLQDSLGLKGVPVRVRIRCARARTAPLG